MSALKFTCPVCGQHMQCEKAYVGHQIPCPSCGEQLRVPVSDAAGGGPDALPRAEIIAPSAAPGIGPIKAAASEIPQEIVVTHESKVSPTQPTNQSPEVHCVCPVCRSELKVPSGPPSGKAPVAELISTPSTQAEEKIAPAAPAEPPPLERERQIAAARAAHPVELYPPIKPRLSYVLSGGAAPAERENKTEQPNESDAETRTE